MKPVLLLIPGMLNSARIWSRVVPQLQDGADVRISGVTTQTTIAAMAADAWAQVANVPETRRLAWLEPAEHMTPLEQPALLAQHLRTLL